MELLVDVEGKRLVAATNSTRTVIPEALVFGDEPQISVTLLEESNSSFTPWTPVDLTGYSIRVGVGVPGSQPTAGTYTLTFGADTTSAINFDDDATAIDTALNALASITAAGGVTVTALPLGFQIKFDSTGAQSLITATTDALYPSSSAYIYEATTGDGSTQEVQVFTLEQNNAAYAELTTDTDGASTTVTTIREGVLDTTGEMQRINFSGDTSSGTYQVTVEGVQSDFIAHDATETEIRTAIEAISTVGAGKVGVYKKGSPTVSSLTLSFSASLGNISAVSVDTSNMGIGRGKTGTISFDTTEFLELLDGNQQVSATLEVVKYNTVTSTSETVLQQSVQCRQDVIANTPASTTPLPTFAAASHTHEEADISNLGTAITLNADTNLSGNSWFLDEDDMISDDPEKVPSQQSVKAYVDTQASVGTATETTEGSVEFATQAEVEAADDTTTDQVVRAKHLLIKKEGTNTLTIGDLSGNAGGDSSITIQSNNVTTTDVASGNNAVSIGNDSLASGTQSLAIGGFGAEATAQDTVAAGTGSLASAVQSVSVGHESEASGTDSTAIGASATASAASATAIGHDAQATGIESTAVGVFVNNTKPYAAEFGSWLNTTTRSAAVRCDSTGQVGLSLRNSATPPLDGGATDGAEDTGDLGRDMYAVRRDGDDIYIDDNRAGTVTSTLLSASGGTVQGVDGTYDIQPLDENTTQAAGNARGESSVDLQTSRTSATSVASGNYSVIAGGQDGRASAINSSVLGGAGNDATGAYSTVAGGQGNTASGSRSIALGGSQNEASGDYSVASGHYAIADKVGQKAHASARFSNDGDAQASEYVALLSQAAMVQNTWYDLTLDGSSLEYTIASGQTVSGRVHLVGATSGAAGTYSAFFEFFAKNQAGTTTATQTTTTEFSDTIGSLEFQVVANDTNDSIIFQVRDTGTGNPTARFVARIEAVELTF